MNISEQFDHQSRTDDKEHFIHLVKIAKVDGTIDSAELHLLQKFGKKMGFTPPEIEILVASTSKSGYNPPYELSKRFEQVYDIVKIILADGIIENEELDLARKFAIKSGFKDNEIHRLIDLLIDGIKQGREEDDLFEVYKKHLVHKK